MRPLTNSEVCETSGGIIPFIIAVVIVDLAIISATAGIIAGAEDQAIESKKVTKHKCTLY